MSVKTSMKKLKFYLKTAFSYHGCILSLCFQEGARASRSSQGPQECLRGLSLVKVVCIGLGEAGRAALWKPHGR